MKRNLIRKYNIQFFADPIVNISAVASETIENLSTGEELAYPDKILNTIQEKQRKTYHVGLANTSPTEIDWDRTQGRIFIMQKSPSFIERSHNENNTGWGNEDLREVKIQDIAEFKSGDPKRLNPRKIGSLVPDIAGRRIASQRNAWIKQSDVEFFDMQFGAAEAAGQVNYWTDKSDPFAVYKDIHSVANRATDGYGFKSADTESPEYTELEKEEIILGINSSTHFDLGNVNLQQGTGSDKQFETLVNGLPSAGKTNGINMVLIPEILLPVSSEGMQVDAFLQATKEWAPVFYKIQLESYIESPPNWFKDLSVYSKGTYARSVVFSDLVAIFTETPPTPPRRIKRDNLGLLIYKVVKAKKGNKTIWKKEYSLEENPSKKLLGNKVKHNIRNEITGEKIDLEELKVNMMKDLEENISKMSIDEKSVEKIVKDTQGKFDKTLAEMEKRFKKSESLLEKLTKINIKTPAKPKPNEENRPTDTALGGDSVRDRQE